MATMVGGLGSPAAVEVLAEALDGLTTVEFVGPAPKVNREPAKESPNSSHQPRS